MLSVVIKTVRACARTVEAAVQAEVEAANRCRDEGLLGEEAQHRYAAEALGEVVDGFRMEADRLEGRL